MSSFSMSGQAASWANDIAEVAQAAQASDLDAATLETFASAVARAVSALQAIAQLSGAIAAYVNNPANRDITPAGRSKAILSIINTAESDATSAFAALASAAAPVRAAVKPPAVTAARPAGLSDTLLELRYHQLTDYLERQGGQNPASLATAFRARLQQAKDDDDAQALYVLTQTLGDFLAARDVPVVRQSMLIAQVMVDDTGAQPNADLSASAQLYQLLTAGGPGTLQGFTQMAQRVIASEVDAARSRLNAAYMFDAR